MSLHIARRAGAYFILDEAGETLAGPYKNHWWAQDALDRVAKEIRQTRRACLCCGESFLSDGAHNRLCKTCRAGTDSTEPATVILPGKVVF